MGLPLREYELSGWKGLNTLPTITDKDPHYVEDCQNVDFDDNGVIAKRRGCLQVAAFSGRINHISDFESQQGFTNATDRHRVVVVSGAVLSVCDKLQAGSTISISATFTATNALHYAAVSNNGACFISNENGGAPPFVLCYTGGAWQYTSAALSAPAAPAVAVGSTGSLTGVYGARTSYNDIFGNESAMSAASSGVTLSGNNLSVVIVPSADPTVSDVNVYLLSPSGTTYKWVSTVSNTTGTFSFTGTDAIIASGADAEYDRFPCPSGKYVAFFNGMLIVAGDTVLPDLVWVSNWGFFRQFSSGTDYARAQSADGQPVRGFGRMYEDLVIAKADSLFLAQGKDNTTFNAVPHNQEYGVLGQPSVSNFRQRLVFFSDDGIYVDNGLVPEEVSLPVREFLRNLDARNLNTVPPKQVCANYKYYKKILFAVRETKGAGGENDAVYVWNYELNTWTRYTGMSCCYLAQSKNADDYEYLFGGDSNGNIFQFTPPNTNLPSRDNIGASPAAINSYVETVWIHLSRAKGDETWERTKHEAAWINLYAGGEPASGNSTITIQTQIFTDFSMTVRSTLTTTHSASSWPTVTCDPKLLQGITKDLGTFGWIKLRFTNNTLDEHFKIHKLVFGFTAKPAAQY